MLSIDSWILDCSVTETTLTYYLRCSFCSIREVVVEVTWSILLLTSEITLVVESIVDSKSVVLEVKVSILVVVFVFCSSRSVFFFSMRMVSSSSASVAIVSVSSSASKDSSFSRKISWTSWFSTCSIWVWMLVTWWVIAVVYSVIFDCSILWVSILFLIRVILSSVSLVIREDSCSLSLALLISVTLVVVTDFSCFCLRTSWVSSTRIVSSFLWDSSMVCLSISTSVISLEASIWRLLQLTWYLFLSFGSLDFWA